MADCTDEARDLSLRLLGGFQVEVGGRTVPDEAWGRPTAKALLKLLALHHGHRLHRDEIADALWPGLDPESAARSLSTALYRTRHALEPERGRRGSSAYIQSDGEVLWLATQRVWVDLDAWEQAAAGARAVSTPATIDAALALYRGDLLPDDRYEDWCVARRERARAQWLDILRLGVAQAEARAEWATALAHAERLLQADPTDEDAHRAAMRSLAASGRRTAALRQYERCAAVLQTELGVEPDLQTVVLADAMRRIPAEESGEDRLPLPVRARPATPFLGRQSPWASLQAALEQAAAGRAVVTLVSGEAGIGKSALASHFARHAARQGWTVLWGSSFGGEAGIPFGAFVEALEGYVAACPRGERADLAAQFPELRSLLPSLSGAVKPQTQLPRDVDRNRLFAAVAGCMTGIAARGRTMLVLDDLHAADLATLALLRSLLTTALRSGWCIVATLRSDEIGPGTAAHEFITQVVRDGLARPLGLLRLARRDIDALVDSLLSDAPVHPAVLDRVWALSLGNPFYASEVVENMRAQGHLAVRSGVWQMVQEPERTVPLRIRESVTVRVQRMGGGAWQVLCAGAVAGMEWTFETVREAAGVDEEAAIDAVDGALAARIVESREDRYAFAHPLFQAALYEAVSPARLAHLHGRIARALERRVPDDVDALATHWAASGDRPRAATALERAGERARAIAAYEAAERYFRDALDTFQQLGREKDAVRVREGLGMVLCLASRWEEGIPPLCEVAQRHQKNGDVDAFARCSAAVAAAYRRWGRPADALPLARDAWDWVRRHEGQDINSRGTAMLVMALARLLFARSDYDESLTLAAGVEEWAVKAGDEALFLEVRVHQGATLTTVTSWPEARRMLVDVLPALERSGDLTELLRAVHTIGTTYAFEGDVRRQREMLDRGVRLCRRIGNPEFLALELGDVGSCLTNEGQWPEARRVLEEALTLPGTHSWYRVPVLKYVGKLSMLQGRWPEAERYLDEALALAHEVGHMDEISGIEDARATLRIRQGDPRAALVLVSPLLETYLAGRFSVEDTYASRLPLTAALALLALPGRQHDLDRALWLADHSLRHARDGQNRLLLTEALLTHAAVCAARGDTDVALTAVEEAEAAAGDLGTPYLRTLCLDLGAGLYRATGRMAEADTAEAQNRAELAKLGLTLEVARTHPVLGWRSSTTDTVVTAL